MQRVRGGDTVAFRELFAKYSEAVVNFAYRFVNNRSRAEELAQDAFLQIYRARQRYEAKARFSTYLYRIVTNLCLDHLRKRKVRREEPGVLVTAEGPLDRIDTVAEARAESDPQRHLFSGQVRTRVKEVLGQLTPRERTVFELRHYQGLRLKRIGEILGTTEDAAKNCLFRATQKMRVALGDFV